MDWDDNNVMTEVHGSTGEEDFVNVLSLMRHLAEIVLRAIKAISDEEIRCQVSIAHSHSDIS